MKKKEEKDKNPLHVEHNPFSNIRYILHQMFVCDRQFFWLIPLGVLCAPAVQYLWTFISKFVIDMITGEGTVGRLAVMMLFFTAAQITVTMANTFYYSEMWWRLVYTRFVMINEKNKKIMSIDFEHLENPDVLDCCQKAANACSNNEEGIEGLMREILSFLQSLAVILVGVAILSTMDVRVLLFMIAMAFISFLISNRTNRILKKKVWDPLAEWWRKKNYMEYIMTDAASAKDIRMFGLKNWLVGKYEELNLTRLKGQKTNSLYWMGAGTASALLWGISQIAVYGWLILSAAKGEITLGNASLYLASASTFFNRVSQLLEGVSRLLARSREVDDYRSFAEFDGGEKDDEGKEVPKGEKYEFVFRDRKSVV